MEACMRAYLDSAKEPLVLSSGLEDYFLGTYYFNKGRYATPVAGLTHFDSNANEFSAYRFSRRRSGHFSKRLASDVPLRREDWRSCFPRSSRSNLHDLRLVIPVVAMRWPNKITGPKAESMGSR